VGDLKARAASADQERRERLNKRLRAALAVYAIRRAQVHRATRVSPPH
jgi:hypothetical protein